MHIFAIEEKKVSEGALAPSLSFHAAIRVTAVAEAFEAVQSTSNKARLKMTMHMLLL